MPNGRSLPADAPLDAVWTEFASACSARPRLRALLAAMKPASCAGGVLRVAVEGSQRTLAERERTSFEPLLERAVGRAMRLEFVEPTGDEPEISLGAPADEPRSAAGADPREHPLVRRVEEAFGARVLDVQSRDRPGGAT